MWSWIVRKNGEPWTCVTADWQWVTVLMATSRLFGRGDFSILDVASITGHKTLTMPSATHIRGTRIWRGNRGRIKSYSLHWRLIMRTTQQFSITLTR